MQNLFTKFAKAKRTIIVLAVCLVITMVVSFHDAIFFQEDTVSESPAITTVPRPKHSERWWELTQKLLLTISAVLIIHLFDQLYLMNEVIKNTKEALGTVVGDHVHLIGAADACGIADIFPKRLDARPQIMDDIDKAQKRVWMVGIGLNVRLNARSIFARLEQKKKAGVDVRILMLDAFRSTAVFRTFLESNQDRARELLSYYEELCTQNKSNVKFENSYFNSTLCREFETTCRAIEPDSVLEPCIRFYAHSPMGWLIITDHKAYFQPYTFGKKVTNNGSAGEANIHDTFTTDETIGDLMPIFKFQSYRNIGVFQTLEDHFLKLWVTSDCSVFHIRARHEDKKEILKRIFRSRREWLRHVYNVLYTARGKESYDKKPGEVYTDENGKHQYRLFQRQICPWPVNVSFRFKDNGSTPHKGRIIDSSGNGLAIFSDERNMLRKDDEGRMVEVTLAEPQEQVDKAVLPDLTRYLRRSLLSEGNSFKIRYVDEVPSKRGTRIGLKKLS